jgi:hypothetical protein
MCRGSVTTDIPRTESSPADGGIAHEIMRIVVVFPAPLGPRKPKQVCVGTSNEIDLTASSLS